MRFRFMAPGPRTLLATSLAALTLSLGPAARADDVHVPIAFEKYTLDNGLEVILHPDHRTPTVAVNVWYHVGSKDEPAGKNGFAHLFEHVMFQGSRDVGEDKFFKYTEGAGASETNGTTNTDRTNYYETVPSSALPLMLWLESDRMGFLLDHVNQETFASQRDVVKNERRQNYENAPYGNVSIFTRAAVFPPSHPYHLATIGSPQDLDAASLDDVRAFFKTFYVPNNATLVLAGDFDPEATKALVAKYFATFPRGGNPPVKATPIPVTLSGETRLNVEADVELPRVDLMWPTPAEVTVDDARLDVVANLLAEGKSSRLYKRLVYDLQIAQSVSAAEQSGQIASAFGIRVTLKKGKDPAEALRVVDEELAKLRAAAPSAEELDRARTPIVSNAVFRFERNTETANLLNEMNQLAHDPGFFDKLLTMYAAVTPADLKNAVSTWLPVDKRVVAVITPTPGAPRAGRLVGGSQP